MTAWRCEQCNGLETAQPFRQCAHCHVEFEKLKQLGDELDKRFGTGSPDTYWAVKNGINHLVALVNRQSEQLRRLRDMVK